MKKFLSLAAIATIIASSCQNSTTPPFKTKRIIVLENNSVSFIHVPSALDSIYRIEDTVWVNLQTHRIDDLDSNGMLSVIKQ